MGKILKIITVCIHPGTLALGRHHPQGYIYWLRPVPQRGEVPYLLPM